VPLSFENTDLNAGPVISGRITDLVDESLDLDLLGEIPD
jgi:hypothetical protein